MSEPLLMGCNMSTSHTDSIRTPLLRKEMTTLIVDVLAIPEGGPSQSELPG